MYIFRSFMIITYLSIYKIKISKATLPSTSICYFLRNRHFIKSWYKMLRRFTFATRRIDIFCIHVIAYKTVLCCTSTPRPDQVISVALFSMRSPVELSELSVWCIKHLEARPHVCDIRSLRCANCLGRSCSILRECTVLESDRLIIVTELK